MDITIITPCNFCASSPTFVTVELVDDRDREDEPAIIGLERNVDRVFYLLFCPLYILLRTMALLFPILFHAPYDLREVGGHGQVRGGVECLAFQN